MKTIYKVKFEDLEILEYWVSVRIEQFTGNNYEQLFSGVELNDSNLLDT